MENIDARWEALEAKCRECNKCSLCETRTNCVFGTGNRNADLMFVGEAPGEKEDESGVPFVGPAGKLFDKYLEYIGVSRDEVYIANILKCRPPQNRDPLPEEQDACIGYLSEQLAILQPKIIVCLGRVAALRLIDPNFKITRDHGTWVCKDGVYYTALYHPSALLRDLSKRPETFSDLLKIRAKATELNLL